MTAAPRRPAVFVAYEVIEHHDDAPPEPYGYYLHDNAAEPLRVGDVIGLRWLDGSPAYQVKIQHIRNGQLHTMSVAALERACCADTTPPATPARDS